MLGNENFAWSNIGANLRILFALGVQQDARRAAVQRTLSHEDQAHGDLIQQDFAGTVHNLTKKLILQCCPQTQFFMTADDNVFIHMHDLVKYLRRQSGARDLWVL